MGAEHELITGALVFGAGEVLHHPSHGGAPRMPYRQSRPQLVGEREQVELDAELAMVAALGLLQAVEMLLQCLLRLPRRAVDALEHRLVLVAPPVGAGDLHQLEGPEPGRRRHVRASAQVDPPVVAVGADHAALRPLGRVDVLDDLDLVRLVGEQPQALLLRQLLPLEGLALTDDLPHARLDAFEVVLAEVAAAR